MARFPHAGDREDEAGVAVADRAVVVRVVADRSAEVEEADLGLGDRAFREQLPRRREQLVGQLGHELVLPVVVVALGLAVVEVGLHLGVGHRPDQVDDRVGDRPEGCERCVRVLGGTAEADDHGADLAAVPRLGDERGRRGVQHQHPDAELPGRLGGDRAVRAEDVVGPVERPQDQPAVDDRPDLVQPERERGDHAEVGTGPADRPEQVGGLVPARAPDPAVGGDDLDLEEVVHRPPEPSAQVAHAAAERQPRHPDLRDEPQRRRESVDLGLAVDVPQHAARLHRRRPGDRVDVDPAQRGHVEGESAVGERGAGDVVASAPDESARACSRAASTAATTSAVPVGRTTRAGVLAIIPFQSRVASPKPSSPGRSSAPRRRARSRPRRGGGVLGRWWGGDIGASPRGGGSDLDDARNTGHRAASGGMCRSRRAARGWFCAAPLTRARARRRRPWPPRGRTRRPWRRCWRGAGRRSSR